MQALAGWCLAVSSRDGVAPPESFDDHSVHGAIGLVTLAFRATWTCDAGHFRNI